MIMKRRLTAMGILEVLMWAGATAAVVTFWMLWPSEADKPTPKRLAAERGALAVLSASNPDRELDSLGLREWRERLQGAKTAGELSTKLKARSGSDWPTVTGSNSLVLSTPDAFPSGTAGSASQPAESTTPAADGSAAPVITAAHDDTEPHHQDSEFAAMTPTRTHVTRDRELSQDENPETSGMQDGGSLDPISAEAHAGMSDSEPQLALLVEPEPTLNLAGLSEPNFAQGTPVSRDEEPAEAAADTADGKFVAEADPPTVTVPEVGLVLVDPPQPAPPEQPFDVGAASKTGSVTRPVDREALVQKADELLDRGDVSGARLLFRRAAESGDARAASGLARTFDAKVLRTLRVYGVRPDPDQAAFWYARSKTLENLASVR
jgi:hypothetical protein